MYDLPIYVWALVLAGAIGIPAATSAVLYRGAVTATTAVVLGGWLAAPAVPERCASTCSAS